MSSILTALLLLSFEKLSHATSSLSRRFSESNRDKKVKMLQQTQHFNFTAFLKSFDFKGSLYVIFDYVSVSLAQVVVSSAYFTEHQLAAILAQVSYVIIMI